MKFRVPSLSSGDTVRVRYSELLTPDSLNLDVENLRHALSTDTYIASGEDAGSWWSPRFSYHGFRFVEVSGMPRLDTGDIVAEVIYDCLLYTSVPAVRSRGVESERCFTSSVSAGMVTVRASRFDMGSPEVAVSRGSAGEATE